MAKMPRVTVKKLVIVLSAALVLLTLLAGVLAYVLTKDTGGGQDAMAGLLESVSDKLNTSSPSSQEEEGASGASREEDASAEMEESSGEASSSGLEASAGASSPDPEGSSTESGEGDAPSSSREEPDGEEKEPEKEIAYHVPDELRGVEIVAGRDYLVGEDLSPAALAAQIDRALASAKNLTMNSIIIDTKYNDSVLFTSQGLQQLDLGFDCVEYLVDKAREMGFFVYATYDVSDTVDKEGYYSRAMNTGGETLDHVAAAAGAFASTYHPDGILLANYDNPTGAPSYAQYLESGGGMGYEAYLGRVPDKLVKTAAQAVREEAPGVQVGLLARAVWENSAVNSEGTETAAPYTSLGSGNADTRGMLRGGLFDFVMVQNYGSTNEQEARFGIVAEWWAKEAMDAKTALYILHASDRVGTQSVGWTVYEQLTKQIIDLEKMKGIAGSAFNSLKALEADPGNSTTTLVQYMNDQINEQYVLQQLAVSKPDQLTFTTKEQTVTFQGASDPQEKVTINGEPIETNESGYFTVKMELSAGENTFVIAHKNKSFTYTITREVEVLKEVEPVGSLNVEGGVEVRVTALAYQDAAVTATIAGQTITLVPSENVVDEELRSSGYILYAGSFTAPAASSSAVQLGNIVVTATGQGVTKSMQGAAVTVNKIAEMGTGKVVQIVAEQAETFPVSTLNDTSSPTCYPLPAGTVDMAVGDEIVYKNGKNAYQYWKLQSGVRVYADAIKASGAAMPDNNKISKMSIKSTEQYTNVTLTTEHKVPYTVSYDGSQIIFAFKYTSSVPDSVTLKNNALFASAKWDGSNLILALRKSGGFTGYAASYDGNKLVLRFNNAPGSLSGARIVVDPGHGGSDVGASGFYPGKDEADINLAIAEKLVSELKKRGANVLMTTPGSTMASRLASARAFNAQVLVSIHGNSSATNSAASGTEVYYFYPFSRQLAANLSANVASSLDSTNRGAKAGLYYMTRDPQFASVLVETGFVSNEREYTKMISSKYQTRIAQGIANGISGYLGGANAGGGTGGTDDEEEEDGDVPEASEPEVEPEDGGEEQLPQDGDAGASISLDRDILDLVEGETALLTATLTGSEEQIRWQSTDENVVTVNEGEVTAIGAGTALIYAYTNDDGCEAVCEVTVGG